MSRIDVGLCVWAVVLGGALVGAACGVNSMGNPPGEVVQAEMITGEEARPQLSLTPEQLEGFEAEIQGQYRQLGIHYEEFDQLQATPELNQGEEAHRLHRKLKRRHLTLARLHEDRLRIGVGTEAPDQDLASLHRRAAKWHRERFEPGRSGVEPADPEIDALRKALDQRRGR